MYGPVYSRSLRITLPRKLRKPQVSKTEVNCACKWLLLVCAPQQLPGEEQFDPYMPAMIKSETILYHFLQNELYESDIWLFQMLTAKLIASLGIWFRPSFYRDLPVILPFAIRDPSARKSNNKSREEWGAPNQFGLFRDDNSLIKNIENVPESVRV